MTESIERSLVAVPLFACLAEEDRARIAGRLTEIELAAGDILFREGDASDDFFIVLDGQLEIVKAAGTGQESVVGSSRAGEFIGEMGLLNCNGLRTATVRAVTAGRLLKVPSREFKDFASQSPIFSCHLASVLSARLTAARDSTIERLADKNRQLQQAYQELQAAQGELIEKRAMEHELALAGDIQRGILPTSFPRFPGYEFDARMVPARSVGGDFYGIFPLDEARMALVVGDVMGKGVPAAIFMAQVYALLRANAGPERGPAETLQRVNRLLLNISDSGIFATLVYGVLYGETGVWRYVRAGHELPLVLKMSGAVQSTPMTEGMPLGIVEEPVLDEACLQLQPGDLLLLYTDGVTDGTAPDGRHFDRVRLEATLRAAAGPSAANACRCVLDAVRDFQAGVPQYDDITLLAVKRSAARG